MAVLTLEQLRGRVEALPKSVERALVRTFRRGLSSGKTRAVAELRKRGITRRIFGEDASGLRKLVKRTRVKAEGGRITGGLEVKGLPALVEHGGKTKAHKIEPKTPGRVLAFEGHSIRRGDFLGLRAGARVFTRSVDHKGSRIPAQPYMGEGLAAALHRFEDEADRELQKACDEAIG